MPFNVGLLIVSDACSKDPSLDQTGPYLQTFFRDSPTFILSKREIVSDTTAEIQKTVSSWASEAENIKLILTCGGTGFTQRDITPEAVRPLIQRHAPGIVHAMLSESLKKTPFAIMSRPVAGVINKSLIITLPGSPTGARENLEAIIATLPHALAQLDGKDSRALHKKMARTMGDVVPGDAKSPHTHATHTHLITHELSSPVTQRARKSPFSMVSMNDALHLISSYTPKSRIVEMDITNRELLGSVLAETVVSSVNVPEFPASIVDGYAVSSSDGPGIYPVVAVSLAQKQTENSGLQPGQIARITTGAPVPPGADSVVMVEETELISTTHDTIEEENQVKILAMNVKPGENIREVGSDLKKGTVIFKEGYQIKNGGEVGLLASIGRSKVRAWRKPTVGILSTGDELKDPDEGSGLQYGQVYDSNRPALISTVESFGYRCLDLGIAHDDEEGLFHSVSKGLDLADYLITSGGVSMGEKDLLKPTIERKFGGKIHFGRVRMKPGKPTTFATIGDDKVIFALPGNPASASVAFHLFVLPSLLQYQGVHADGVNLLPGLPRLKVRLVKEAKLDDQRPEYQRAYIYQNEKMELVAEITGGQRSSRIGSFRGANGLVCLPAGSDVGKAVIQGEVEAIMFGQPIGRVV
ncbi:DEKNAAC102281 [Brettanomyces naardenensis]|uniref:DEKNAAC102281 n=1 Tax=Brettanomyces naardenensis TaxID=13370 RepID=A0A448YLL9_BRENA|nr:DEKNAAC102281 [Brettanomyces naardenensis]